MILILIFCFTKMVVAEQNLQCGEWDAYKDIKCFKVLQNEQVMSYENAKNTCYQYEASSLVTIHSVEEQEFLFNLLKNVHKIANDVWIGGQYKETGLKWTDNTTVNYTNWANDNPRNDSGYECVKISIVEPYHGKWINEPCSRDYVFVCQKLQNWLFTYLQKTVMTLRDELEATKDKLNQLSQKTAEISPPGTVAYFTHTTAPLGWFKANGQSVSRTTYANLFASIGTTFGSGDGSTTFTLPDLRGEFIRGWSDGRDVDKDRAIGSFQWGSNIPLASQINGSWENAGSTGFQSRWAFSGETFDDGFEINVPSGQTRDGTKFPDTSDLSSNEMYYISAPNHGFINNWNILKGTRPRNIALLACIKF